MFDYLILVPIAYLLGSVPFGLIAGKLAGNVDILVATPGRLLDFQQKRDIDLSQVEVLVLDEATSALDSRTEQAILATLKRVSEDRTTLAIAHRLSTIADADRILVLEQGRLAESGTHSDLLAKKGIYAEMWARQQVEKDFKEAQVSP